MMKSSFRQMLAGDHPLGGSAAAKTGNRKPEPGHYVVNCHRQNPERDPAIVLLNAPAIQRMPRPTDQINTRRKFPVSG